MPKKIYSSKPVSLPEVKRLLLDREIESKELTYMQRIALEHAMLVSRITAENAKQLIEDLVEKFRLSDKGSITLANYMPDTIDEIRALLGKEATLMETETVEQILETLNTVPRLSKKDKEREQAELEEGSKEEEELEEEDKEIDESMIPEDLI